MDISEKEKIELFCNATRDDFEKLVEKILNEEPNFEEYDKKLDPLIRSYFSRLSEIDEYFHENGDNEEKIPEEEYEDFIKLQKLSLTITLCDRRFKESVTPDIVSNRPISELEHIVIPKFNKYLEEREYVRRYFYNYYGLELPDE